MGGSILPGIRLAADALSLNTAKLPTVEIVKSSQSVGRSTIESIQSGVYYGALGACRELIHQIKQDAFSGEEALVIATGGFASLFDEQGIFDINVPDLVLQGLLAALKQNIKVS